MGECMRSGMSSKHWLWNPHNPSNKEVTTYSKASINTLTGHSCKFPTITIRFGSVFVGPVSALSVEGPVITVLLVCN